MTETLTLDILTPTGPLAAAHGVSVPGVEVPGALGALGLLPRHRPILTPVVPGVVRFRGKDGDTRVAVGSGFLEVSEAGRVTILTERACLAADVDVVAVKRELDQVLAELASERRAIDDPEHRRLLVRRDWFSAQLRAAGQST